MSVHFLSHYQIRQIYIAKKLGFKNIKVSLDLGQTKQCITIEDNFILFPDGQKINFHDLVGLMRKNTIVMIKDNEIYEMFFKTPDGRIYKLISNGELDYPNLEISGRKLFNKDIPIKDLVKNVVDYFAKYQKILVIGAKLGYYSIALFESGKNVVVYEEDRYMLEMMKYNPLSKNFFEYKIKYRLDRIYSLKNIPEKSFDGILYCPPPFCNATRYFYSKVVYNEFYRILKPRGLLLIDIELPMSITTDRLIKNTQLKLKNIKFSSIEVDKENLFVLAKK